MNTSQKRFMIMITMILFMTSACSKSVSWKDNYIQTHTKSPSKTVENSDKIYEKNESGYYDFTNLSIDEDKLNDISIDDLNNHTVFDTLTKWPDSLPEGFHPTKLLDDGKVAKLGLTKLHDNDIDGSGVGIAVIGDTLLTDHEEIKDNLSFYVCMSKYPDEASLTGVMMASITAGKNVGVAPKSKLYYINDSIYNFETKENDCHNVAQDIIKLIEMNKDLKNKIRVISLSEGYFEKDYPAKEKTKNADELTDAIKKAKEEGIEVLCQNLMNPVMEFTGLYKTPYSDVNDIHSYYLNEYDDSKIYVPTNDITVASLYGNKDYMYYIQGGQDTVVPYVSGLYALACQVNPSIAFNDFLDSAKKTAYKLNVKDDNNKSCEIMIIQPEKLMNDIKAK